MKKTWKVPSLKELSCSFGTMGGNAGADPKVLGTGDNFANNDLTS